MRSHFAFFQLVYIAPPLDQSNCLRFFEMSSKAIKLRFAPLIVPQRSGTPREGIKSRTVKNERAKHYDRTMKEDPTH